MLSAVCRILVGHNGRRLPAYPDIQAAYTLGLFSDYFKYNPFISRKTAYKYANATMPYPHFLVRHYVSPGGYRRTLSDMMNLVDACPSIFLLRQVQKELRQWVEGHLPAEEAAAVCQNHIAEIASRREIAVFFADTMHYALTRHHVGNRPAANAERK